MLLGNIKNVVYKTTSKVPMPLVAFVGRFLFAFVFIIVAIQEYADYYGNGGGRLQNSIGPAVNALTKYGSKFLTFYTGMLVPAVDVKQLEFFLISVKATAAFLFIFGGSTSAYFLLVVQILSTFIPFPSDFHDLSQNLTFIGALLYYIGLKNTIDKLIEQKDNKNKNKDPSKAKDK